jgi:hypothetical protein
MRSQDVLQEALQISRDLLLLQLFMCQICCCYQVCCILYAVLEKSRLLVAAGGCFSSLACADCFPKRAS